jgi:DNA polymerase-3 subunit epsilon
MRQIVLDTETTGLDPLAGHRIIEIGCIELVNQVPTSHTYHRYINPGREITADAVAVHGLTNAFLEKHPAFEEIVDEFLAFIGDDQLVIHNADFDMRFLNAEVTRLGYPAFPPDRALCTLKMTRKKFPGAPASLDALCARFKVDNSGRGLHGGLLDAQLLAEVYMELLGGRQAGLGLGDAPAVAVALLDDAPVQRRAARIHAASAEEAAAHAAMLAQLKAAMWLEAEAT